MCFLEFGTAGIAGGFSFSYRLWLLLEVTGYEDLLSSAETESFLHHLNLGADLHVWSCFQDVQGIGVENRSIGGWCVLVPLIVLSRDKSDLARVVGLVNLTCEIGR